MNLQQALAIVFVLVPLAPPSASGEELSDLWELYRARDYFSLRDRLEAVARSSDTAPEIRFLQAALEKAFNEPERSNKTLDALLEEEMLSPTLEARLRHLQATNYLRLHRYREALEANQAILGTPVRSGDAALIAEASKRAPLLAALSGYPPQQTEIRAHSRLKLGRNREIPLQVEGAKQRFALDTGANFSVIRRSLATQLGLRILPVGLEVATATTQRVLTDVAVADRVRIGNVDYRHVVFLVFPDQLLDLADGRRLQGLVGFPLVEAMGEVRFRRDSVLEIPSRPPKRTLGNLALDDLEPLVPVRYGRDVLVCRLDTGAPRTVFYEPFFRRYQERFKSLGDPVTATVGGVGGTELIPSHVLPKLTMNLAARGFTLRQAEVYTQPVRAPWENYLYCNVGLDVLQRFRAYVINFRDMALVLE